MCSELCTVYNVHGNIILNYVYLYINLACLSVCLYPINVKTAEPIGPNFFCGTSRDHRESLWMIKIKQKCVLKVFNFVNKFKFLKIREFFLKIRKFFFFFVLNVNKKNMFTIYKKIGAKRPKSLERRARSA